ncbi:MAG: IclR family transcriptional regulator [Actinomycetota bacterium]|nr:IclR family transcriptional regulator [Actinomycetota bacterium]
MDSIDGVGRMNKGEATSGVGVLDKAVGILAFLATDGPASLAEVVEGTGLARPTAHRLLSALETHHLVARGEGRYALGMRLLGWGNEVAAGAGLVGAARPALTALRDATGESTQLYVREGDARVCVATVERATGLKTTVPVGAVLPLVLGSAGKVLLAWAEDRERFPAGPEASVLEGVRRRGWAESVAEREEGVASVSAPVFDGDGGVRAAVSASGPIARLGANPGERLAAAVVSAARKIEEALGNGRTGGNG